MSTEQNKTIVRQRINAEMISQNRLDLVDELFAESFVDHSAVPGLPANRDGVRMFFGALHAAFSGLHVIVEDQVAEGDKVVTRKTFHGAHTGDFFRGASNPEDSRLAGDRHSALSRRQSDRSLERGGSAGSDAPAGSYPRARAGHGVASPERPTGTGMRPGS